MGGARILVVDDNYVTRTLLEHTLELEGYEVISAGDGQSVFDHLNAALPALIVLDVMMPGMDGFAVLDGIRANPETKELPVLMLTALDDADSTWKGWSGGCDYYMNKPFDTEELLSVIQNLLSGVAA